MSTTFSLSQKIKMGFGGLFLAFLPAAIITAVLFTHFSFFYIWFVFLSLLIFGFYAGTQMLTESKLPKFYFWSITAISLIMVAVLWVL